MKVGIDIVDVARFESICASKEKMKKVYTSYEIKYIQKAAHVLPRMAGLYAAKEALVKALGIGLFGGLMLSDICVKHDDRGKPYLELTDKIKAMLADYGLNEVEISISHTDTTATAICILM